jgi:hypothetical protein
MVSFPSSGDNEVLNSLDIAFLSMTFPQKSPLINYQFANLNMAIEIVDLANFSHKQMVVFHRFFVLPKGSTVIGYIT